jgi:predicted permease
MTHRSANHYNAIARLRPGVSREQATRDLETIMQGIVAAYPNDHLGNNTIALDPMWRSPFGANGYMAASLPILLAIAGVVLLLTCANVTTLTLVRFVSRRREIAIRQSLGAGRVRLVRQMVMEGAFVSIFAGAMALLLTLWTGKSLALFIPPSSDPIAMNTRMDSYAVFGTLILVLFSSVLCGAFPAWRSAKVPAAEVLKEESASVAGGKHNRRLMSGLVVAQIALSFGLLVCSVLFLCTLRNTVNANPGFEQDHILTASVGLSIAGYSNDEAQVIRHRILDRVRALPEVTDASITDWVPMCLNRKTVGAYPGGYLPKPHESIEVRRADVTSRYFEMLGMPILEGRAFTQDDNEKSPSALVVDETAASRYWPGQDPLGKKLMIFGRPFTVVGLVRNSKHAFMNELPEPMIYMSYFQNSGNETIVQIRTRSNPESMAPAVEEAIHEIDRQLPVFDVRTLHEATQMARIFTVLQSTFAEIFAAIALILAATGIYGVVAYRTQLRTHEVGIRVALGASRTDVLRLVLLQGFSLTMIGLGLGLALSFGLTRFIAGLLYGIGANDPLTVAAVFGLLGAISLLACYFPARRAMHVNPVAAIREQ